MHRHISVSRPLFTYHRVFEVRPQAVPNLKGRASTTDGDMFDKWVEICQTRFKFVLQVSRKKQPSPGHNTYVHVLNHVD